MHVNVGIGLPFNPLYTDNTSRRCINTVKARLLCLQAHTYHNVLHAKSGNHYSHTCQFTGIHIYTKHISVSFLKLPIRWSDLRRIVFGCECNTGEFHPWVYPMLYEDRKTEHELWSKKLWDWMISSVNGCTTLSCLSTCVQYHSLLADSSQAKL